MIPCSLCYSNYILEWYILIAIQNISNFYKYVILYALNSLQWIKPLLQSS